MDLKKSKFSRKDYLIIYLIIKGIGEKNTDLPTTCSFRANVVKGLNYASK